MEALEALNEVEARLLVLPRSHAANTSTPVIDLETIRQVFADQRLLITRCERTDQTKECPNCQHKMWWWRHAPDAVNPIGLWHHETEQEDDACGGYSD